ncbi:MAG: TetR/AcrR family transcriptional regulator [Deltaproteobacteria bacterium]|jgi:AcrR family transcriptional regulator|nr:TetR/AcrR family transcriptional regulator [Deltaproteobacteria bacterium]
MARNRLTVLDQIAASDKVRKKIIDAASALYAKKGFGATSIQEISEAANVALPVTYHFVKKKSGIMRLIMEDVLNIFQESLLKEIQDIAEPVEKLAIAVILYLRVLDRQREKVLLIYQKSGSLDRDSKKRIMALEVEVSEIFSAIIKEGIAQGVFKTVDVDLMAYNIIILSQMWILKHWHFKKRLTLDKYIDSQLSTIMDALGATH